MYTVDGREVIDLGLTLAISKAGQCSGKRKRTRSEYPRCKYAKIDFDNGATLRKCDVNTTKFDLLKLFYDDMRREHSSCSRECGKGFSANGFRGAPFFKKWITAVMGEHGLEEYVPRGTRFS